MLLLLLILFKICQIEVKDGREGGREVPMGQTSLGERTQHSKESTDQQLL